MIGTDCIGSCKSSSNKITVTTARNILWYINFVMNKKLKQWLSTIPPISTKRIITSHLNWTQKRQRHMTLEVLVLAWDRHTDVAVLNWLIGPQPSPLDNWISNGNTYIWINYIKKPTQIIYNIRWVWSDIILNLHVVYCRYMYMCVSSNGVYVI